MRILYFADIRFPLERANGVQTAETCHGLARRGHDVRLVVRPDTHRPARDPFAYYGLAPEPRLSVLRVTAHGGPAARRAAYLAVALARTAWAGPGDVVLTRDLAVASLLVRLPARLRPPVVYESHGFAPAVSEELPLLLSGTPPASRAKRRRLAGRERRVWRQVDGYVTITAALGAELEARFGPRPRLVVIPDGTRLPAGDGGRAGIRTDGPPVVGYAGHLYPWKGLDILIQALRRLPGIRGLIIGGMAGEHDLERIRGLADQLAPGQVTFVGQVEPFNVPGLLRQADVLVLPNTPSRLSAAYTSPLKLFEYMASGRPIVASDLPALREILRDGDNALLVEPGNPEALAVAIARVASDAELAARLATRARHDAAAYTWDARAARVERLLVDVVARGSTAPAADGKDS